MDELPATEPGKSALRLRLIFLGCAVVLLGAALLVGISDNPPGLALAFLSSVCVVLAVTFGWRHPRKNYYLFVGSFLAFAVAAILHNVFEAAASVAGAAWLKTIGEAVGAAFFLAAVFLCPAGIVVGAIGGIVAFVRRPGPPTARVTPTS